MSGNDHASSKCAGSSNGSLLVRMDLYVGYEIYHLITAQKTGDMPEEIRDFDENIYLSPVILFEYFDLLDEYGTLTGKAVSSADHPSPRERQEHIFDLFDEIPKELITEEGNEVLNIFFDFADRLKNITLQQL